MWNVAEPLEVEYRQPIHQSSDQSNSSRKEIENPPCGKETESRVEVKEGSPIKQIAFDSTLSRSRSERTPDMRAIFQAGINKTSIQFE